MKSYYFVHNTFFLVKWLADTQVVIIIGIIISYNPYVNL